MCQNRVLKRIFGPYGGREGQKARKDLHLVFSFISFCPPPLYMIFNKANVKLSLCFNWAPRHEGVLGEWRYSSMHSLTSALDGGEWSASHPGCFTPRERAPGTRWIGFWVGPRTSLDVVMKRKILSPCRDSNPPIIQPVAHRYTTELCRLCDI
jgi:hypothetical protein